MSATHTEARFTSLTIGDRTIRKLTFGPARPRPSCILEPQMWDYLVFHRGARMVDDEGREWRFKIEGLTLTTVCPDLGIDATTHVM